MRNPSVKTIASRLSLDTVKAKYVRGLIDGSINPYKFASVQAWVARCYNAPSYGELVMCALNELLDGHGIEAIRSESAPWDSYWCDIVADYVNMGDTYTATIVRQRGDKYMVCSWGDYFESTEKKG